MSRPPRFTSRFRLPRPSVVAWGVGIRGVGIGLLALALGVMTLAPLGLTHAQPAPRPAAPPPKPVKPPFPAEAQALLSTDDDAWLAGVAALRANPRAREILLQALANRPSSPRRWRLAYHLIEWGRAEDVPLLDTLLDETEGPERRAIIGALTALYPRPSSPLELSRMVSEFTYLPQNAAEPFAPDTAGKVVVTDLAIQTYHQDNLPVRVIERVMGLKGRAFDGRGALAAAIQGQLQGRQWADFGEKLLAPVSPIPARLSQSGTLQIRLTNPAFRPALLVLHLTAWYGRFEQVPTPLYVLVKPGETVTEEVPVRLIAPAEPGRPRIFLRFYELNAPGLVEAVKLEVPIRR